MSDDPRNLKSDWIKSLIESISLFTILYIFVSYGYQYFYFHRFKINIVFYQTTRELIFSPVRIVLLITACSLSAAIFTYIVVLIKLQYALSLRSIVTTSRLALFMVIPLAILVYSLYQTKLEDTLYYIAFASAAIFFPLLFVFLIVMYRTRFSNSKVHPYFKVILYLSALSIFIFFLATIAKIDYLNIITVGPKNKIVFFSKSIQYKTTDSFFQIGETSEHIFFFNKVDTSIRIFKKSEMDSLVIK
jgi:hypothetical protein